MRQQGKPPALPRSYILLDKLLRSRVYRAAYYVHRAVLTAKVVLVIAMLACIVFVKLIVDTAHAAPPKPDYAKAYAMAARCMVYNSFYKDKPHALVAFDAWKKLGQLQGLENAKMNVDMDFAVLSETKKLNKDAAYRRQTQVDCRALGWAE